MLKAIVYTSNTGNTAAYAQLLGKRTGLPVCSLGEAKEKIQNGAEIIYLGWLMAGSVKGFKNAAKLYNVRALCGVGMAASGTQDDDVKSKNTVAAGVPVFTLQGGFDISKLHGIYRFMMNTMKKTAGKALAEKTDRTAEEDDMLDMFQNGGTRVSEENLAKVFEWYDSVKA